MSGWELNSHYQDEFGDRDLYQDQYGYQDQYEDPYSYFANNDYQYNSHGNGNYQGGGRNRSSTSRAKASNSNSRGSRAARGNNPSTSQGNDTQAVHSGFIEVSHASKDSKDSIPSKSDGKNIVVNIVNINHEY
ncbi:uncharacterized protein LOC108022378 [Drosophila biarmipes]|uniref:uncharacterized protein LOC108022378 n=1 Tax=Drosophila biarmipes TaxID=125945 RepID=UPI0007E8150D|nr:uncharacterized protein LOC108022378 [Drosophila biarmipes]XP_043947903.1 uncharacterized protein LOC108022378 [Drosophila biarmipes]